MSNKDRHRLKRTQKQRQARRRQNNPFKLVTRAAGEFQCYCTSGWRQQGIAWMLVRKTLPSGGHVLGAYLVDFWCCGLKDAYGRLDITSDEFEEAVEIAGQEVPMEKAALSLVQEMVAGGIRFARQNGFRLPKHYERWVGLIGVDPDAEQADLRLFGVKTGGKRIRYIGSLSDLNRRLVGMTAQEFLARPDVEYITEVSDLCAEEEDLLEADEQDDTDEALEQMRQAMHARLLEKVRQWCFANLRIPHPALPEAIDAMLESLMQLPGSPDAAPDDPGFLANAQRLLDQGLEMYGPEKQTEMAQALDQLSEWIGTFDSPEDLIEAMGLTQEDDEE